MWQYMKRGRILPDCKQQKNHSGAACAEAFWQNITRLQTTIKSDRNFNRAEIGRILPDCKQQYIEPTKFTRLLAVEYYQIANNNSVNMLSIISPPLVEYYQIANNNRLLCCNNRNSRRQNITRLQTTNYSSSILQIGYRSGRILPDCKQQAARSTMRVLSSSGRILPDCKQQICDGLTEQCFLGQNITRLQTTIKLLLIYMGIKDRQNITRLQTTKNVKFHNDYRLSLVEYYQIANNNHTVPSYFVSITQVEYYQIANNKHIPEVSRLFLIPGRILPDCKQQAICKLVCL